MKRLRFTIFILLFNVPVLIAQADWVSLMELSDSDLHSEMVENPVNWADYYSGAPSYISEDIDFYQSLLTMVRENNTNRMRILLEQGLSADVEPSMYLKMDFGFMPLLIEAVSKGHYSMVELLLEFDAEVNKTLFFGTECSLYSG